LVGPPDGDAHPLVLDLDLRDTAFLDDPNELANPLLARFLERGLAAVVAVVSRTDRAQQRLGLLAEERDQDEFLLARREALGLLPDVLPGGRAAGQGAPHAARGARA